ncbi:hypothetical protein [Nitrosovibrio sp. Nv4]|uniref:hypothetical protein n=1 Tax=Nitrosovibrio sp. Nv4 TaxID=1945880 RepID=UPI000BD748C3|nr:hypothetical protein [Nitrosovibrio sp. Nv4]SOD41614.1 hypothetical protein SAMN06298226_1916 [Nitrosovibrio sp. Nv4]
MSTVTDTGMESEKEAAFASLRARAAEIDGIDTVPETAPAEAGEKLAGEIAGLVAMFVKVASPALPSLSGIYTEETTAAAAQAVAAVCKKHGWMQDGVAHGYGEEVAAACVLLPLAFATYQGVKHDLAASGVRQVEVKPVPGTGQVAGAKTVIIGAPVAASDSNFGSANG